MDHDSCGHCKYFNLPKDYSVADLAAFHGHLGPYIVIGYRIGRYARTHLGDDPFRIRAKVHCSGRPPDSCLADGVQIGSGCTLGKGNITVVPGDEIRCEFVSDGKVMTVLPRQFTPPSGRAGTPEYEREIEVIAERIYHLPDSEIFDVHLS